MLVSGGALDSAAERGSVAVVGANHDCCGVASRPLRLMPPGMHVDLPCFGASEVLSATDRRRDVVTTVQGRVLEVSLHDHMKSCAADRRSPSPQDAVCISLDMDLDIRHRSILCG